MCLSFHPSEPAVVAGGSFSGEVLVWNTGREGDPLLASSGFTDLGHKEPVAKVGVVPARYCQIDVPTLTVLIFTHFQVAFPHAVYHVWWLHTKFEDTYRHYGQYTCSKNLYSAV